MRLIAAAAVTGVLVSMLAGGCTAARPVTVEVLHADTHAPAAGAEVIVRPLRFFLPMHPYPQLGSRHRAVRGVSDEAGRIEFARVAAPSQVVIIGAAGAPPQSFLLEDHPRAGTWLTLAPEAGAAVEGEEALVVRISN